jgi:outer membrane protein assembly factor BamB
MPAAALDVSATRTIVPQNVSNTGGSFNVSVEIVISDGSSDGGLLSEYYQSSANMENWTISNIDSDTLYWLETGKPGEYEWGSFDTIHAGIYYVNYTMTVGEHEPPGIYEISGTWYDYEIGQIPVTGDSQVALTGDPVLTSTNWPQFQMNLYNNGVTADNGPLTQPNRADCWATYTYGIPGRHGIDTEVLVVGDYVYAVGAGSVFALNRSSGEIEWTSGIAKGITVPLATPAYGNGKLFVGAFSQFYAFDAINGSELWNVTINSSNLDICQINTPLTYDNGRIYFGEWLSYTLEGDECKYYCYDEDGNEIWNRSSSSGVGYYWAGAAVIGRYLVYPDDNMIITSVDKYDGATIDEVDIKELLDIGFGTRKEIRASLMYDPESKRLYTTTEDGYCIYIGFNQDGTFNTSDAHETYIGSSTSTPTLYNGKIYLGTGKFSGDGGVLYCLNAEDLTQVWKYTPNGGVQASPALSTTYDDGDGEVYIYFTTNILNGTVYCLKDYTGCTEPELQWTYQPPSGKNEYTLHGVSINNRSLFYGNDAGYVFRLSAPGTVLPVAGFSADVTSGTAPLTVNFTDQSANAESWSWDFNGDGKEDSTDQNPQFTYTDAGTYNVSLTVTNAEGSDTETKTDYINCTLPFFSFMPEEASVAENGTTEIVITVDYLPEGLAGYNLTLDIDDPTVAEIVAIEYPGWANLTENSSLPGTSIYLKVLDGNSQIEAGATNVVLATLTVKGKETGNTSFILGVDRLDNDNGDEIEAILESGTLEVTMVAIPGQTASPQDLDGDGFYEDLSGDGSLSFVDVELFFHQMDWIEDNTQIEDFDLNGNGRIDFADIVDLFQMVV